MIKLMPGTPADHAFVFATWLKAYRPEASLVRSDAYFAGQHTRIERLLRRGELTLAVPEGLVESEGGPTTILGYSVTTGDVLHWLYVKAAWRRMGIAKALVAAKPLKAHSHRTSDFERLHLNLSYDPYLAE